MDKYSKRKKYIIASILDWRSKDSKKLFYHLEKKLGIDITFISLLSGEFTVNEDLNTLDAFINKINSNNSSIINKVDFKNEPEIISLSLKDFKLDTLNYSSTHSYEKNNASCYLKSTGRFGIDSSLWNDEQKTIKIGKYLKVYEKAKGFYVLAPRIYAHIPMKIASYMGDGKSFILPLEVLFIH